MQLEAQVSTSLAFMVLLSMKTANVVSEDLLQEKWHASLGLFAPPWSELGFPDAQSLAAFVHVPPTYCVPERIWKSISADDIPKPILPCIWLVRFIMVCSAMPTDLTLEEMMVYPQYAMPQLAAPQEPFLFSHIDRHKPYVMRVYYMIFLLKVAAILTGLRYQHSKMQPALTVVWQMVEATVQGCPSAAPQVQAQDGLMSTSALLVELAVPLLRQLVTTEMPVSILGRNISLAMFCNLLAGSPNTNSTHHRHSAYEARYVKSEAAVLRASTIQCHVKLQGKVVHLLCMPVASKRNLGL